MRQGAPKFCRKGDQSSVVSKLITDRRFRWGEFISDYRQNRAAKTMNFHYAPHETDFCGNVCRKSLCSLPLAGGVYGFAVYLGLLGGGWFCPFCRCVGVVGVRVGWG